MRRLAWLMMTGCAVAPPPGAEPTYTEERAPCSDRDPLRKPLFGDLHVHAGYSFDARNYGSMGTPDEVLAFARGVGAIRLPPLDEAGAPTLEVRLDRPLDFVALTEHGDFLGEVAHCTTPGSLGYDTEACAAFQGGDPGAAFDFGVRLAADGPTRDPRLCGEDGFACADAARARWQQIQSSTEAAYDRTDTCGFTPFVGYEYSSTPAISNLHRNIFFRNARVPDLPVSVFEAPLPEDLWAGLRASCEALGEGCESLVIPHNSNLSNGRMFLTPEGDDHAAWVDGLKARAAEEPLVELHQHKGQSECRIGLGTDDPDCAFEQVRPPGDPICGDDEPGTGGMRNWGCTHPLDWVRNVLLKGLALQQEVGVNPFRLGFIGSTDTHNGIAGRTVAQGFVGHVGTVDDTPEERLGDGNITHDAFIDNPGGLVGVWSVENSRDAIWEALHRRETWATSGPRIAVRMFAGEDLPDDLCGRADGVQVAYQKGVPMGGEVSARRRMRVWVQATADAGTADAPGVGLGTLQIVKGWVDADGVTHEAVFDVATGAEGAVDSTTCAASGGSDSLCAMWEDPAFNPDEPAFWYARVLEVQTCRWSTRECNTFDAANRPPRCGEGWVEGLVRQRAWGSPIWSAPR